MREATQRVTHDDDRARIRYLAAEITWAR